jgi:glycerol-3-phosphate dehydrogenase
MKRYDVIIIGAGVVGTSIARELSRYKLKIALLEKEEELAFGVSKSNSGIIHPGTQHSRHSLKGKLCVRGNILMRKVSRELGVDFKEVGELIVAFEKKDLPRLTQLKKEAQALGVPKLQMVNRSWLKIHEPNLSQEAIAALYAPTAGIISPYRLVYDMAENALKNQVEIYTQNKVTGISACGWAGAQDGHFFEIITSANTFRTKYLINAAGLYADEISRLAGVSDFRIRPRKGEEFILDKKKEHLTNHLLFPLPSKNSKGILVIKTADGNPMIGPTAQDCDDKEDLSTSDEGLEKVLRSVKRMIPSISEKDIIAYFAGLRPVAGDDFIIRHEEKVPGFINVAGIQSPGLTAAPAIALLVRDILKKRGLSLREKRVFHKHRKKEMHLFAISLSQTGKLIRKDSSYGDIVCRCEMVSAKEIKDAIARGARTLDGIKFRTRAQAGRCHGSFCTTRIMKILAASTGKPLTGITKRGPGSEVVREARGNV